MLATRCCSSALSKGCLLTASSAALTAVVMLPVCCASASMVAVFEGIRSERTAQDRRKGGTSRFVRQLDEIASPSLICRGDYGRLLWRHERTYVRFRADANAQTPEHPSFIYTKPKWPDTPVPHVEYEIRMDYCMEHVQHKYLSVGPPWAFGFESGRERCTNAEHITRSRSHLPIADCYLLAWSGRSFAGQTNYIVTLSLFDACRA